MRVALQRFGDYTSKGGIVNWRPASANRGNESAKDWARRAERPGSLPSHQAVGQKAAAYYQGSSGSQAQGYAQARLRPWVAYTPSQKSSGRMTRGPSAGAVDLMPSTRRYY
jgi:hypothetical protein